MITEKQLAANQRNAQLSTGPRTEEGKKNSSLNARRHNLTGQVTAMTDEDRAAHDEFSSTLIQNLAPEGAMEFQLAQRIATDSWRLNRTSAIEDNLFAIGFSEHANDVTTEHPEVHAALIAARFFTVESKHLELLTLYEQRMNRSLQKNLALLKSLQAERKEQYASQLEEAGKLLQLSEFKGLRYEPAKDGFVFSNDEVHIAVDRQRRLERARTTDFTHFKPRKLHARTAA
jgi:hypothetical protein